MAQWVVLLFSSGSYNDNSPTTTAQYDHMGVLREEGGRGGVRRVGDFLAAPLKIPTTFQCSVLIKLEQMV